MDINTIYEKLKQLDYDNIGIDEIYDENESFGFEIAKLGKTISGNSIFNFVHSKMPTSLEHPGTAYVHKSTYRPLSSSYLNPKAPTAEYFSYDMNLGIRSKDDHPEYDYLTSFSIKHDRVITGKLRDIIVNGKYSHENFVNNVVFGQYRMFHNSIKTRGMMPKMMYAMCVLLYRCDSCHSIMREIAKRTVFEKHNFNQCYCFTKSAEFMMLCQLIDPTKGIPFYWGLRNSVEKVELYESINCQTPVIMIALFDLIIRHRLGAVDEITALHIVNLWSEQSDISFHSAILGKFKKAKEIGAYIRTKLAMHTPVFSMNFDINGMDFHSNVTNASYDSIMLTDFTRNYLKDVTLTNVSPTILLSLHDMSQYFSPSIHINGAVELILKKTAQATQPSIMTGKIVEEIDFGATVGRIPSRFTYQDPDVDAISELLYQQLLANPPNMNALESGFLESATTNSAGLTPDEERARQSRLVRDFGASESESDVTMISKAVGVRIFDVIETSRLRVKNLGTYLTALTATSSVGMRYQVARRPRAIIMLNTIFMYGPWLVKRMYDRLVYASEICATGKTSNNLKDSFFQCYNTARNLSTSSDDVVGMDTSTHKMQTAFVMQPIIRYARDNSRSFDKFFFQENYTELTRYTYKDDNTNPFTDRVRLHAVEIFLLLENFASNMPRMARGGFFMILILIGAISFESGTYKTTVQHTVLLQAIYTYLGKLFADTYAAIGYKLRAQVSGDDQTSASAMIATREYIAQVTEKFQLRLREILLKFGYQSEALVEFGYGEFLKQAALLGVPMPYGVRLAQFSSERGDAGGVLDRINNMFAISGELSSRVPFPAGIVLYKNVTAMMLGIQTINLKYYSVENDSTKLLSNLKKMNWHSETFGAHLYVYPRRYWMYAIPIGAPILRFSSMNHNSYNFLEFPSPGYLYKICNLVKKEVPSQHDRKIAQSKMTPDSFIASIKTMGQLNRRQWMNVVRRFGKNYAFALIRDGAYIPLHLDQTFDLELAESCGLMDGYFLEAFNKGMKNDLPTGKMYNDIKTAGNLYLDPTKRFQSSMATKRLHDKGIIMPDSLVYTNRIGARLDSVLVNKDEPRTRVTHIINLIENYQKKRSTIFRKFTEHVQFGLYTVKALSPLKEDPLPYDVMTHGFGPCIPPNSLQAQYLNLLGPPNLNTLQYESVSNSISDELLLPGAGDSTMRLLVDVFAKGGLEAFELALTSIGVSDKVRDKVTRILYSSGFETKTMPYAFSPRLSFFYNADYPGTSSTPSSRRFVPTPNIVINDKIEWAVYISHLYSNCHLIQTRLAIDCKYAD